MLGEPLGGMCVVIGMKAWEDEPLWSGLHAGIVVFATPSGRGEVRNMAIPMLVNAMRSR